MGSNEVIEGPCPNTEPHPAHDWRGFAGGTGCHCRGVPGMTAAERDQYENQLLGAGMVWAALAMGQHDKITVDIVYNGNLATNQMLVKFPFMPGPPGERGYLLTVTIPAVSESDASRS